MQKKLSRESFEHGGSGKLLFSFLFPLFFFLICSSTSAQEVQASIDTASIKIGEQITYTIAVETDSTNVVVFPEGQTFMPLEMIESFPVDTNRIQARYRLIKEYALTQFDSGSYTIPQQRLVIDDRNVFTDSMLIEVADVVVDTTKQKMFPIKPSIEVPSGFSVPVWLWWLLVILLVLGLIGFLLFRRKKRKDAEAKRLPPYEQALFELRELDNSHLLEQREIKEYYSQLSAAVRRYLDEEVYDHAMESTTSELIAYLEAERDKGHLKLQDATITRLKVILERADLAKFANSKPDVITAKEDRSSVENVINDTKASIPEPTEEELLRDKEYREKLERKKRNRKIIVGVATVLLVVIGVTTLVISIKGVDYFKDTVFGNKTKDLLEGQWIRSEYGTPPVAVTTPDVLVRSLKDTAEMAAGKETFRYGSLGSNLFIDVNTRPAGQNFELEKAVEEVYSYLEERGAKNILTKQEEVSTINGAKGLKIFGTMLLQKEKDENPVQKNYTILNYAEGGGYQQIVVIYDEADTYAEEIAKRITDSVELRNLEK